MLPQHTDIQTHRQTEPNYDIEELKIQGCWLEEVGEEESRSVSQTGYKKEQLDKHCGNDTVKLVV